MTGRSKIQSVCLTDGATIPFISRYRKEMTGSLDEVKLIHIKDEYNRLKELDARRESIIKSIEEQEKMTPELREKIDSALTMAELEDIYLPYRPKTTDKGNYCTGRKVLNRWPRSYLNRKNLILKLLLKNI